MSLFSNSKVRLRIPCFSILTVAASDPGDELTGDEFASARCVLCLDGVSIFDIKNYV